MKDYQETSYLAGVNAEYLEEQYEKYRLDPSAVSVQWQQFFSNMSSDSALSSEASHAHIRADLINQFKRYPMGAPAASSAVVATCQSAVDQLIHAYRQFGFIDAKTNPLHAALAPESDPRFQLEHYGLSEASLSETVATRGVLPVANAALADVIQQLQVIYMGTTSYEYFHIRDEKERSWLQDRLESDSGVALLTKNLRRQGFKKLVFSDGMERYLEKKYVAQKRFSLEGNDTLVPLIDRLIQLSSAGGAQEMVLGMSHRGRVNVLMNNLGLEPESLYQDFEGPTDFGDTSGDLKYHRGYSSNVTTDAGKIHLSLMFNPSHLEYIGPVVMGSVRARQALSKAENRVDYAIPLVMHGDAAFSGEGSVVEALNMSQLRAYHVGGTIHIVVNNQIGFTTFVHEDARTSYLVTDAAKMIDMPVIHVNADDLDAVLKAAQLAYDYRMTFHKDIVIDLIGYRRHGHQEADEPSATAPMMYKIIKSHPRSIDMCADVLLKAGVLQAKDRSEWSAACRSLLDDSMPLVESTSMGIASARREIWSQFTGQKWRANYDSRVDEKSIRTLAQQVYAVPDDFNLQRQVKMLMNARSKMGQGELPMDWGFGEMMAYASLLSEGYGVRLVGQDTCRGTFFHRHYRLFDQATGAAVTPLANCSDGSALLEIFDSPLNEAGALGFEYGYSVLDPKKLVIWEAQFGDFYNVAQVVVDQFISSSWQKWKRLSGLVMLLPHGQEGQGPEHSSGRLERFLQLCAQDNIQVCVPTTPAQMFHLLRRQVRRSYRRPLVVFTPKSLLRHKLAVSTMSDLSEGQFQLVIPEVDDLSADLVERVVLCSGKVYYDLLERRRELDEKRVAIIRVEELYPFPYEELRDILHAYQHLSDIVWCQEEPKNQGAWFVTRHRLQDCVRDDQTLRYVGREPYAAPSSGYLGLHRQQQELLVEAALKFN